MQYGQWEEFDPLLQASLELTWSQPTMRMTDRFGFITYKTYVLQGTGLFLLFNSFFPFFNNKNKHQERERERERERRKEKKAILEAWNFKRQMESWCTVGGYTFSSSTCQLRRTRHFRLTYSLPALGPFFYYLLRKITNVASLFFSQVECLCSSTTEGPVRYLFIRFFYYHS